MSIQLLTTATLPQQQEFFFPPQMWIYDYLKTTLYWQPHYKCQLPDNWMPSHSILKLSTKKKQSHSWSLEEKICVSGCIQRLEDSSDFCDEGLSNGEPSSILVRPWDHHSQKYNKQIIFFSYL